MLPFFTLIRLIRIRIIRIIIILIMMIAALYFFLSELNSALQQKYNIRMMVKIEIKVELNEAGYHLKNYGDLGGCRRGG